MIPQNTAFDRQLNEFFQQNNWLGIVRLLQPLCQPDGELWDDPAALATFGFALTQLRRWQQARQIFYRCIDLEPDRAVHYYSMGYVEYAQLKWDKAIYWFDEALQRYPDYFVVLYRKGYALLRWNKAAKARPVLEKGIQVYQQNTDEDWRRRNQKNYRKIQFTLARVFLQLHQPEAALELLSELLQHDKRRYIQRQFLFYELGKTYYALSRWDEAIQFLNRAAKMKPEREFVWDQLGRVYHRQQQYQQAIQCYKKALNIRKQAYIYTNLGVTYWAMQQTGTALYQFQLALKHDHQKKMQHKVYLLMGRIHLQNEQFQQAEHYYRAAIQAKHNHYGVEFDRAYYELALCYMHQGKKDQAQKALQAALTINPELEWDNQLMAALEHADAELPPIVDVVLN